MTRRTPAFARAFAGRWRIAEMDQWEDIDFLEPAHITFVGKESGELVFGAVEAELDSATARVTVQPARSSRGRVPTTIPMQWTRLGNARHRGPSRRAHLHL
jgi:polyisoprenoid-binding protein YceI